MKVILTHADIAQVVAYVVARDLVEASEERCGPEQAIVEWSLERPDDDPDLAALAGLVYALSWEAASERS